MVQCSINLELPLNWLVFAENNADFRSIYR